MANFGVHREDIDNEFIAEMAEEAPTSHQGKQKVQRTSTIWSYFDSKMRSNEKGVLKEIQTWKKSC